MHRAAKAEALKQVAVQAPGLLDPWKTFGRWARELDINDIDDLKAAPMPPQQPPVDQAKLAGVQAKVQGDQIKADADMATTRMEMADRAAERENRLRVAMVEQNTERLRLASTIAIHSDKTEQAREALTMKIGSDTERQLRDHIHDHRKAEDGRLHERDMTERTMAAQEPAQ